MSALVTTYADLLATLQARIGQTGTAASLAMFLTDGMQTCWEMPEGKNWVWPFTVQTATVTPGGSGQIALADLDYGVWASLWNTDPRPVGSGGRTASAYPISWSAVSAGFWPELAPATIFAFYIKRAPEYTSTVAAVSTAYAADAIVYDSGRAGSTGKCFRCVAAYTSDSNNNNFTTELADATKWVEQPVYKHLMGAALCFAHAHWLRSLREDGAADQRDAAGMGELEKKFIGIYPNSPTASAPPWISTGAWR